MLLWVGKPAAAAPKPARVQGRLPLSRSTASSAAPRTHRNGRQKEDKRSERAPDTAPANVPSSPEIPASAPDPTLPPLVGLSRGAHQAKGTKRTEFSRLSVPQGQNFRGFPAATALQREGGSAGTARPCWRSRRGAPSRWVPEQSAPRARAAQAPQ